MTVDAVGDLDGWWAVRMVVDITLGDAPMLPADPGYEDRIILVRASSESEARAKGESEAASYNQEYETADGVICRWTVRGISDVQAVITEEIVDGIEVYSAFIDNDWAERLMRGADSPMKSWARANPGKDPMRTTVGEMLDVAVDARQRRRLI